MKAAAEARQAKELAKARAAQVPTTRVCLCWLGGWVGGWMMGRVVERLDWLGVGVQSSAAKLFARCARVCLVDGAKVSRVEAACGRFINE